MKKYMFILVSSIILLAPINANAKSMRSSFKENVEVSYFGSSDNVSVKVWWCDEIDELLDYTIAKFNSKGYKEYVIRTALYSEDGIMKGFYMIDFHKE